MKYFATLAVVALLAAGCSKTPTEQLQTNSVESSTNTSANTNNSADGQTSTTFTMADIEVANTPDKCYTVISGSVYNLTAWIEKHPGGDKNILKLCGKDGTSAYTGQHGGQPQPEQTLASFKIGTLK